MKKKGYIFFDFDGVIADSFDAAFAVNKIIDPHITEQEYRDKFLGNINEAISLRRHSPEYNADIEFFSEYAPRLMKSPLCKGMAEVVRRVTAECQLMIISSTTTGLIKNYLKSMGIADCFDLILGNDVETSKEKKIKMAFETCGMRPSECIFITDTLGDIIEARKMGIAAIAVTWGYQPERTLEKGNPVCIVRTSEQLASVILSWKFHTPPIG